MAEDAKAKVTEDIGVESVTQAALDAGRDERVKSCTEAIQAALAEFNCTLEAQVTLTQGNVGTAIHIVAS